MRSNERSKDSGCVDRVGCAECLPLIAESYPSRIAGSTVVRALKGVEFEVSADREEKRWRVVLIRRRRRR